MQRMKVATEKHDKKIFKRGLITPSPVCLFQFKMQQIIEIILTPIFVFIFRIKTKESLQLVHGCWHSLFLSFVVQLCLKSLAVSCMLRSYVNKILLSQKTSFFIVENNKESNRIRIRSVTPYFFSAKDFKLIFSVILKVKILAQ